MLLRVPPVFELPPIPPNAPLTTPTELRAMIHQVFGTSINELSAEELSSRAILTSTVKQMMIVNNFIIASLNGQEIEYLSLDVHVSDDPNDHHNFPVEYLNLQQPSGMPPHSLKLKVGAVVMLLRNIERNSALSNGTRLLITHLNPNSIVATILSERDYGETVFLSRLDMSSDEGLPFMLRRNQFPLIPAFSMTINKSQGQTLGKVGIYLHDVTFSHGQLYVALSRCRRRANIVIFVKDIARRQGLLLRNHPQHRHRVFTRNVVYREVFIHGEIALPPQRYLEDDEPELARALQLAIEEEEVDVQLAQMDIDNIRLPDPVELEENQDEDGSLNYSGMDYDQEQLQQVEQVEQVQQVEQMIFTEPNVSHSQLDKIDPDFRYLTMLLQDLSRLELQAVQDGTHQQWLRAFVAHYLKCNQIQDFLSREEENLDREEIEAYLEDLLRFYSEDYPLFQYAEENICQQELIDEIDQCDIWQLIIVRVIRNFFQS